MRRTITFKWKQQKNYYIFKFIHDKFTAAVESRFIVHDINLQRWALQAQEEIGNLNPIFKASHN